MQSMQRFKIGFIITVSTTFFFLLQFHRAGNAKPKYTNEKRKVILNVIRPAHDDYLIKYKQLRATHCTALISLLYSTTCILLQSEI